MEETQIAAAAPAKSHPAPDQPTGAIPWISGAPDPQRTTCSLSGILSRRIRSSAVFIIATLTELNT